jgi:hypothetical protein
MDDQSLSLTPSRGKPPEVEFISVLNCRESLNGIDIVLAIDMLRWLYSKSCREALGAITG